MIHHQFPLIYPSAAGNIHRPHQAQMDPHSSEHAWHQTAHGVSGAASSPAQSTQLFPVVSNRRPDLDYPSPAPSHGSPPYLQQLDNYASQSPNVDSGTRSGVLHSGFEQIESCIGPDRVLTRRQRAALVRRSSLQPNFYRTDHESSPRHAASLYVTPPVLMCSRPQTPSNADSPHYSTERERICLNIPNTLPMQMHSPQYPLTPASTSSSYSRCSVYGHSRSNSSCTSGHPRSASPALSVASALTSVSSSASGPSSSTFAAFSAPMPTSMSQIPPLRQKQRKQRLFNVDRKAICLYHQANPGARQEDIAVRYGVERSTISKILKNKTKWLNVPEHEGMRIAKHRPSKFPEIEEELVKWLTECTEAKTLLSDAMIRAKAKETARLLNIPEDKFKASSGWVENFKHRHGIRGGVWHKDGKNIQAARALGSCPDDDDDDDCSLRPDDQAAQSLSSLHHDSADVSTEMDVLRNSHSGTESQQQQTAAHMEPEPLSLQPAWPESTETAEITASLPQPQPPTPSPHVQQHPQEIQLEPHMPLSTHQSIPEHDQLAVPQIHHETPVVYENTALAMYQEVPSIPVDTPPTLAEAEDAINKLLLFIDTEPGGIITDEERQSLNHIKCALFQAGSGVPYDRNQR